MAARRTGRVVQKTDLSPQLSVFRLCPEEGTAFPAYEAGQYIALGRDDARLTKQVGVGADGKPVFARDLDENGKQRLGPVMHSYSIASAPFETAAHGWLEFYIVQEVLPGDVPGRLSTALLGMSCGTDDQVNYVDRIVGSFTLGKLVKDAQHVMMIGTGTGLAPFVSMVKQIDHESRHGSRSDLMYTLLHTNRTFEELAYHEALLEIEASATFDFRYLPTVSRPTDRDRSDPRLGVGRATNVLRLLYELPMKEEEAVGAAAPGSPERAAAEAALARTPRPALPATVGAADLRMRLDPSHAAVILTCGNPASTADIQHTAERVGIRAEVEPW